MSGNQDDFASKDKLSDFKSFYRRDGGGKTQ